MTRKIAILIALPLLGTLTGCATIVNGTSQELHFTSEPTAAQVFVNGEPIGYTPLLTKIQRNNPEVVLKKEGYQNQNVYLEYKLSGFFWVDFFLLPLVGPITDTITDSMSVYEPTFYHSKLKPQ
ncbi:MAG: PEGA domain-containing protein [Nitrospirae bacterium]|nr:MAG: PEGA domain-containing protein [Nitrospirota bacterium]